MSIDFTSCTQAHNNIPYIFQSEMERLIDLQNTLIFVAKIPIITTSTKHADG